MSAEGRKPTRGRAGPTNHAGAQRHFSSLESSPSLPEYEIRISSPAVVETAESGGGVAGLPAANEHEPDGPVLPPESLLETVKQVHSASLCASRNSRRIWRATFVAFLCASRACCKLGLPVLLRDLDFRCYGPKTFRQIAAFLEDGLGMDKFRAVRVLKLYVSGRPDFYGLIESLLHKVGSYLEVFEVSVVDFPPEAAVPEKVADHDHADYCRRCVRSSV